MLKYIKRRIIEFLRKSDIGNAIILRRENKYNFECMINEYVEKISNVKKYIIFGTDKVALKVAKILKRRTGKKCEFFVDLQVDCEQLKKIDVKSFDIISQIDDLEQYKIVISPNYKVVLELERLLELGVEWKQIILGNEWKSFIGEKGFDGYDLMLGYTRINDIPGFTVYGNDNCENFTIVVLGNSTTDPYTSNIKSWVELMYNQLQEMGINAKILCGALTAYHSGLEVLKMLRDVLPMKPDLVISYGGINDTEYFLKRHVVKNHPFSMLHQRDFFEYSMKHARKDGYFHSQAYYNGVNRWTLGIENHQTASEFWVNNERIMHALCEEFGITFYAFLQPCRDYGGYIKTGEPEKSSYRKDLKNNKEEIERWYDQTRSYIQEIDYIIDLTEIFSGQTHVYYDYCHVFEKGNIEIARRIISHIIKDIYKRVG